MLSKGNLCTLSAALLLASTAPKSYANNIERIVLGQVKNTSQKPWAGKGFTKVKTINGVTYGFTRHKDAVGNFDKFTIDRSYDGGYNWENQPNTVVTNADLIAAGAAQGENYTYNQFESMKWFQCPGTGKWSIYAKRLNANSSGQKDYVNGKQLFGATVVDPQGSVDSPYSAVRLGFPYGSASGDLGNITVDGKAYIISTGRDDHTIRFLELTDDCSDIVDANVTGAQPAKTLQWYDESGSAEPREAPAIFQHQGYFYMVTSGATGWRPNQQKYASASEFLGDWSDMKPIGDRTAYHSQVFWVKGITASDGSGTQTKLFNGTRNAPVWNGTDSRDVVTPMYFNTPESLATNHYDYIDINHTTGEVTGGRYDHGTKLGIADVSLVGYSTNVSNLIDGDLNSSWYKGNVSGQDVIVLDLGQSQLIKALKVKQYDNFNSNRPGEVEQKVFKVKIEVGDGSQYETVFEDIVPSISWLHPLNLIDKTGRYIKITRLETHNGGSSAVHKHFGFYEMEVWGGDAESQNQVAEGFENDTEGSSPTGLVVYTPDNISATVSYDLEQGKVLRLADFNANETAYAKKVFTPQSGSNLTLEYDFMVEAVGGGEKVRLREGNTTAFELVNSALVSGLAIAQSNQNHIKIADITPNTWYSIKTIASTDSSTFDVYLDGSLIWGGARFQNNVQQIDTFFVGSGWTQTGFTGYFDNLNFHGPISDKNTNPDPDPTPKILLEDDFESALENWSLTKGTWQTEASGANKVLTKVETNGTGFASTGNQTWTDYKVSAEVKRLGQSAGILGRYSASNRYYQFSLRSDGTFLLNKNVNGNWSKLASGNFSSDSSTYYKLGIMFEGVTIKAFIDDVEVASVKDNDLTQGSVGFRSQNGSASFDNLLVEE